MDNSRIYRVCMARSDRLLKRRKDLNLAATLANLAAICADGRQERAAALGRAGICLRLVGELELARDCLDNAISLMQREWTGAEEPNGINSPVRRLLAGLLRDQGMVSLDNDMPSYARQEIVWSLALLREDLEPVDYLNSYGFLGRVELKEGNTEKAREIFLEVVQKLHALTPAVHRDVRVFELNATIWLLKVLSPRDRWPYALRCFQLASDQGNLPRIFETGVLTVGGDGAHRALDLWH